MIGKKTRKKIMKCLRSGMNAEEAVSKFGASAIIELSQQLKQIERSNAGRSQKQFNELFSVAMSTRHTRVL